MTTRGIDIRQTASRIILRASLKDSAGVKVTTGTTELRIYRMEDDGTLDVLDWDAGTKDFVASGAVDDEVTMSHQQSNGSDNTGIWTYVMSDATILANFDEDQVYIVAITNSNATPETQEREFQFGGVEGDQSLASEVAAVKTDTGNLITRIGAFTGSGINNVLGFLKSLLRKDVSVPSDIGGTYSSATDSQEAQSETLDLISPIDTGARTVITTVNDGTNPLESARVRYKKGAERTTVKLTNASGQCEHHMDDGTWEPVITLTGYSDDGLSDLVVDGDETETYSLTLIEPTPSSPGFSTGYLICRDKKSVRENGAKVSIRIVDIGSDTGNAMDDEIWTETSSSIVALGGDGAVEFEELLQGADYEIRRGFDSKWNRFTVPALDSFNIASIIGKDI
jgi:hypothetical protein